jgi:hypothetical protein
MNADGSDFDRLLIEIDHVVMGMTVIASTRGVGLLPAYAQNFLTRSVTSRPLKGNAPTVDLVFGYKEVEQISHPKALAFEIGRVGRSCFAKKTL